MSTIIVVLLVLVALLLSGSAAYAVWPSSPSNSESSSSKVTVADFVPVTKLVAVPATAAAAPPPPPQAPEPYLAWNPSAENPVAGGTLGGAALLVCQAEHEGPEGGRVTQPGYALAGAGACSVGYWGRQVDSSSSFRLLDTNKPATWAPKLDTGKTIKGGWAGGETMYVCRGKMENDANTYLGKAAADWGFCLAAKEGKEVTLNQGVEYLHSAP